MVLITWNAFRGVIIEINISEKYFSKFVRYFNYNYKNNKKDFF